MKTYILITILSFFTSLILCVLLKPVLRRLKVGQNILGYVKEHKKKNGTPTMCGLAFILAAVAVSAFFITRRDRIAVLTLAIGVSYMIVGLLDDYLKIKRKENLGLRAWQKIVFQICIALFAGIFCYRVGLTVLFLPFSAHSFDVGGWIVPIVVFVFVATVNAVNLTDGLDGLASAVSLPFFAAMGIVIGLQGAYSSLTVVSYSLVGALLAYLIFNVSPASVFMGDTGSLALGGFAACISCFSGNILYIAVIGVMFVLSTVSVILQVVYFKCTKGKRIFLMAPLHHHFQKKGYAENKISYIYFIVTSLIGGLCVFALL